MANVQDVAAYILRQQGEMSAMKLQKLVYYSQAWHLVWDEEPLFNARIEAWANGPVVRELFNQHRGRFSVSSWPTGNSDNLGPEERGTIDAVLRTYGHLSGRQLSYLTHHESPWLEARQGLAATAPSSNEIPLDAISDYYSAVDADDDSTPVDELHWKSWAGEPDSALPY